MKRQRNAIGTAIAFLALALLLSSQAAPAYADQRESAHVQVGKSGVRTLALGSTGLIVADMTTATPEQLVTALVGDSTVPVSNIRYTGSPVAGGTFTGGTGIIGFESGIMLSTGAVSNVVGPNQYDDITARNRTEGDPSLEPATFDAAVLEFDFVPDTDGISFQYVFASDEYNEYVTSDFNDVFAFYVNGVNRALLPGTDVPVSINTVNGGKPVGTDPQNPEYFINNELPFHANLNTEMDGLTTVLTLQSPVQRGQRNHLKLVIADVGDNRWDSNVFIKSGSFVDGIAAPPATTARVSPAPNAAGWNRSDVTVALHAIPTVPGDSVKAIHYRLGDTGELVVAGDTAQVVIGEEGTVGVTYFAVDGYDLAEPAKTLTAQIDKTPPFIAGVAYREPNEYGWYRESVPVGFDCRDALSGIYTCVGFATVGEGKGQTVYGTATDKAGNIATASVPGISVDMTPPVIAYTGAKDFYAWDDQLDIACTATDALSGIAPAATACRPIAGPASGFGPGTFTYRATAADFAGNTAAAAVTFTVQAGSGGTCALIDEFVSQQGVANSLCVKITNALADRERGNYGAAFNLLEAFKQEVQAQSDRSIRPGGDDRLLRWANGLESTLPNN